MKFLGFGLAFILVLVIVFIGFSATSHTESSILNAHWAGNLISIIIAIAMLLAALTRGENAEMLWDFAGVICFFLFLLTLIIGLSNLNTYLLVAIFLAIGGSTAFISSSRIKEKNATGIMPVLFFITTISAIVTIAIS